jgi:hypothetical protein
MVWATGAQARVFLEALDIEVLADGTVRDVLDYEVERLIERAALLWALVNPEHVQDLILSDGATSSNRFLGVAERVGNKVFLG